MKITKRLTHFLVFTLTCFLISHAQASHMMGGEITYKWLGNKKYELTMKVYRDCRGIPFNSPDVQLFGVVSGAVTSSTAVNYTRTSIVDITVLCSDTLANRCSPENTTSGNGVEEHTFVATVDFAAAPFKTLADNFCEIYIKMEQCCRNGAITTINAGNFYVESMMNICNSSYANSSPQFFNVGSLNLACNQPFKTNFGGSDWIDNDSLVYELVNPMSAHGTNETYTGNHNQNLFMTPFCPPNPGVMNCKPLPNAKPPRGLYFNTKNGDFVITPTKCDEVAVVSVMVSEYRNINGTWKKLGHVIRDLQLSMFSSGGENVVPEIIVNDDYVFTTREKTCFDIGSFDTTNGLTKAANKGNITRIKLLNAPSGAEFGYLDSSKDLKTGRFCWTPHDSAYLQLKNISKKIPLTIEVVDNYCQLPAITRKTVFIKILPPDSSGFVTAHTFTDRNKNWVQNNGEKDLSAKLLVNYKNSTFSLETDTAGLYADSFGHGNYLIGPASHPYLYSLKGDTSIQVMMDSAYELEFPIYKKNGIYGRIYTDQNNNCIYDSLDQPVKGIKVFTDSGRIMSISNGEGLYYLPVTKLGNYLLYCNYRPFEYMVNCPSGNSITVNYSSDSTFEDNDFGISENDDFTDIQVSLSLIRIRRGATQSLKVQCYNNGNQTSRNITLSIPVPKGLDLKVGNVLYAKGGDTAVIQIDSILSKDQLTFAFNFYTDPDSFKADDQICFTVKTDSICFNSDSVKYNNVYTLCRIVDAPYDPNEKLNAAGLNKTKFDNFIDYTVHFQNTGTDTAFRVMVTDTIDTRYLDPAGFELQWSDASCVPYIVGNVLYFVFDNIQLPQLATSGDLSISGFGFRMGLKSDFPTERSFENRASIFFDFEDPVITEPAVTNILSPISILSLSKNNICATEPNHIEFKANIEVGTGNQYKLELSDVSGSFENPTIIASKSSVKEVDSFVFFAPKDLAGNYLLRISATEPATFGIPASGHISFDALATPNYLINTNINNYQLCQNDTLIMDLIGSVYQYKVFRNNIALSNFSTESAYRFKLEANDKFMVVALDLNNGCTDTNRIKLQILPAPMIKLEQINAQAKYCYGDSIQLKASGGNSYTFYNKDQVIRTYSSVDQTKEILKTDGLFWVYGDGNNGCHSHSDSITTVVNPLPNKPVILANNNNLSIPYYSKITWFIDDVLSADTGAVITNAKSGKYQVKVQNQNNCKNESDPYIHFSTSTGDLMVKDHYLIYPNPAKDVLYITHLDQSGFHVQIYNMSGQLVYSENLSLPEAQISLFGISSGLYNIQLINSEGEIVRTLVSITE